MNALEAGSLLRKLNTRYGSLSRAIEVMKHDKDHADAVEDMREMREEINAELVRVQQALKSIEVVV